MKKIVILFAIVAALFAVYWFQFRDNKSVPEAPRQQALLVNEHSAIFNANIDSLLQNYFTIKAALVEADSVKAKLSNNNLVDFLGRVNIDELKKEPVGIFESATMFLNDIRANTTSFANHQKITEMRQDFKGISDNLYPFLKTIHYEGKILYWQNCPMAFGENNGANWISSSEEIINPYMGKHHPEYKGTMLHCGEVKDSIKAQ